MSFLNRVFGRGGAPAVSPEVPAKNLNGNNGQPVGTAAPTTGRPGAPVGSPVPPPPENAPAGTAGTPAGNTPANRNSSRNARGGAQQPGVIRRLGAAVGKVATALGITEESKMMSLMKKMYADDYGIVLENARKRMNLLAEQSPKQFEQLTPEQQLELAMSTLIQNKKRRMNQLKRQIRNMPADNFGKLMKKDLDAIQEYDRMQKLPAFEYYNTSNQQRKKSPKLKLNLTKDERQQKEKFNKAYAGMTNAQKKELRAWFDLDPLEFAQRLNTLPRNVTNPEEFMAWQRRQNVLEKVKNQNSSATPGNMYFLARQLKQQQQNQQQQGPVRLSMPPFATRDPLTSIIAAVLVAMHVDLTGSKLDEATLQQLLTEWKASLARRFQGVNQGQVPREFIRYVNALLKKKKGKNKRLKITALPDDVPRSNILNPDILVIAFDPPSKTFTPMVKTQPTLRQTTNDKQVRDLIQLLAKKSGTTTIKTPQMGVSPMGGAGKTPNIPTTPRIITPEALGHQSGWTSAATQENVRLGTEFSQTQQGKTPAGPRLNQRVTEILTGNRNTNSTYARKNNNTNARKNNNTNASSRKNSSSNNNVWKNNYITGAKLTRKGNGNNRGGGGGTVWYNDVMNGNDAEFTMAAPFSSSGMIIGNVTLQNDEETLYTAYREGLLASGEKANVQLVKDGSFLPLARHKAYHSITRLVFLKPDASRKACKAGRSEDDAVYRFMSRAERTEGCWDPDTKRLRVSVQDAKYRASSVGSVQLEATKNAYATPVRLSSAVRCRVQLGNRPMPMLAWMLPAQKQAAMLRAYMMSRLVLCGRNPHFPMVYGAAACSKSRLYTVFTESFHTTLASWLKSPPALQHVVVALVQVLVALASMHSRRLLHGNVSPTSVLVLKAAPYKNNQRWSVYRLGNRNIALSSTGPLFALANFSKTTGFPRQGAPAHCEVVKALQMFKPILGQRQFRKEYKALTNFARASRFDAALFLHNSTVLQTLASIGGGAGLLKWDKDVPAGLRAYQKHDVLPQEYRPQRSGRGPCDTSQSVLGAIEELGRSMRASLR